MINTMPFVKWIAIRLGTRRWFVGPRWSYYLKTRYDTRLSISAYERLEFEYHVGVLP